ncbi:V-type proton ATPase subunit S1-like [Lethenteron reissneri]|uniref:V-type proton ATPase subunit S1-like n=1 Tax=Lethenteron reissneri TaxID=7753 RepID=UPI002AB7C830|nr:V-type proton ATPase subunit S1-like [Lethenteron reissneri]
MACSSLGLLLLCLRGVMSVDQVPLLVWSHERLDWGGHHPPSAGHVVETSELYVHLSRAVQPGSSLVIFMQDKLSVDDFTKYGAVHDDDKHTGVFKNVKALFGRAASKLFLPAVDWKAAAAVVEFARERLGPERREFDEGLGSSQVPRNLDPHQPNLVVYRLPATAGDSASLRRAAFAENDEIIGNTLATLTFSGINFTAIYTALRPSRVAGSSASLGNPSDVSRGRKLLAVDSTVTQSNYKPLAFSDNNGSCILFWASNITLVYTEMAGGKAVHIELADLTFNNSVVDLSGSSCSSDNATLSLRYNNVSTFPYLTLRFVMTNQYYQVTKKNWFSVKSFELEYAENTTATFNTTYISSLEAFSYHCQFLSSSSYYGGYLYAANPQASEWTVTFQDFQIQGFNVGNSSFSYASDCASFFTPAIWMFLVSTTVLVLILTYGVQKILAITTLDRFDDPKGPTLAISQSD